MNDIIQPKRGLLFAHRYLITINGEPMPCRVTNTRKGMVYYRTLYFDQARHCYREAERYKLPCWKFPGRVHQLLDPEKFPIMFRV